MNTIYWRMNATQGGVNLHPGVNLLPGANLHPGAYCAHEHGFKIVHSQYFLHPKFQASSDILWSYSPVCVDPGRKPRRQIFS